MKHNDKTRVMMPAAFMAIAGMLLGAGIGDVGLSGNIGGVRGDGDLAAIPCVTPTLPQTGPVTTNLYEVTRAGICQTLSLGLGPLDIADGGALVAPVAVQGHDFTIAIEVSAGGDAFLPFTIYQPAGEDVSSRVDDPEITANCSFLSAADADSATGRESPQFVRIPYSNVPQPEAGKDGEYEVYPPIYADVGGVAGLILPTSAAIGIKMHAPLLPPSINWKSFTCYVSVAVPYTYVGGAAGALSAVRDAVIVEIPVRVVPESYVLPLGTCDGVNDDGLAQETVTCVVSEVFGGRSRLRTPDVPLVGPSPGITYNAAITATYTDADSFDDDIGVAYFTLSYHNGDDWTTADVGQDAVITGESEGAKLSNLIYIGDGDSQTVCGGLAIYDKEQSVDLIRNGIEGSDTICLNLNYDQVDLVNLAPTDPCTEMALRIAGMTPVSIFEVAEACGTRLLTSEMQSFGAEWVLIDLRDRPGFEGLFLSELA